MAKQAESNRATDGCRPDFQEILMRTCRKSCMAEKLWLQTEKWWSQ